MVDLAELHSHVIDDRIDDDPAVRVRLIIGACEDLLVP